MTTPPTPAAPNGDTQTPMEDAEEAKFRAAWLHARRAPSDWLILRKCELELIRSELATARAELAAAQERAKIAEASTAEQFRLYCEETKKHNATSALLARAKEDFEYAANALTEHAEAVGVSPDHVDYIDLTTKAIIDAWSNKTRLEAQLAAALKERDEAKRHLRLADEEAREVNNIANDNHAAYKLWRDTAGRLAETGDKLAEFLQPGPIPASEPTKLDWSVADWEMARAAYAKAKEGDK